MLTLENTAEVKSRPILMSGPMMRAILEGRKVQTRRILKTKDDFATVVGRDAKGELSNDAPREIPDWQKSALIEESCPYGVVGDRLRIKESAWMWCEKRPNGFTKTGRQKWHYVPLRAAPVHYVADHPKRPTVDVVSPDTGNEWGWRFKVGRFLPKWASRITLEITGVRVERLKSISRADAAAEGVCYCAELKPRPKWLRPDRWPEENFLGLWESINGADSVKENPFVWVVEFKVLNHA